MAYNINDGLNKTIALKIDDDVINGMRKTQIIKVMHDNKVNR